MKRLYDNLFEQSVKYEMKQKIFMHPLRFSDECHNVSDDDIVSQLATDAVSETTLVIQGNEMAYCMYQSFIRNDDNITVIRHVLMYVI